MSGDLLRKLAAIGLSLEQSAAVMDIMAEEAEERKAKVRARVQKWRDKQHVTSRNVTKHTETLHEGSRAGDARVEDISSNLEISGKKEEKKEVKKERTAAPRGGLSEFKAELSSILDAERVEALVAVRRSKNAAMTGTTGRLLVAAIRKCPVSPAEVADEMALRNWTSVKPGWLDNGNRHQTATGPPNGKRMNAVEANLSRRAERNEPGSGRLDNSDAELLPPDGTRLRALVGDVAASLRWPDGSGRH